MQFARIDTAEIQCRPAAGSHSVHGCTVHLYLADPHLTVAREESQPRRTLQWPSAQRSGDDGAAALDGEDAVDRQRRWSVREVDAVAKRDHPLADVVDALAGHAGHRDHR